MTDLSLTFVHRLLTIAQVLFIKLYKMNCIRKLLTYSNYNFVRTLFKHNKNKTVCATLLSGSFFFNKLTQKESKTVEESETQIEQINVEDFTNQIKKACEMSEEKVKDLIKTVTKSIQKTCEDYRKNLDKQGDVIKKGMNQGPLSEIWDDLVKQRVDAETLKQEIAKFQSLVDYIGQIIFNLNICTALMDTAGKVDTTKLQKEFDTLVSLTEEQLKLNKQWEQKMLELDKKNIMKTKPDC